MTTLEIILIIIVWVSYGVFNSYQHDWYKENYDCAFVVINTIGAPIALVIRIIRGVFFWKGKH